MKRSIIAFLAFVLAIPCEASELTTRKNLLYPPQASVVLQDDFLSGGTASGIVGTLGFAVVTTGSLVGLVGETNRPGIVRLSTSSVAGEVARVSLYAGSNSAIQADIPQELIWITRLNTNDANTIVRIGSMNSTGTDPPTRGIYFEKLAGDTNWFCVARESSTETRTDSGVAVSTSFATFLHRLTSSGAVYSINGTSVCGTINTNLPSATQFVPAVQIVSSAAASKTIDIEYFQLKLFGITR